MTTGPVDVAERNRLVMEHVGLVKAMAYRLLQRVPAQVELSDLIGVGVMGLLDAAERYRPSVGVPFDAFARRRLQGAMLDSLRDLDWAPRSARKLRREMDQAVAALRQALGREPDEKEIAGAMGLADAEYGRALDSVRSLDLVSMRQLGGVDADGQTLEVAIEQGEGPDRQLERAELRRHLADALAQLPDRDRQVLALYYEEELTMAEIGEVIGVSESRVSQIRSLALTRLRATLSTTLGPREGR
ncbi:MAG TPA: RNA polymerase sigma factor FliA [Vicinamibacterales bacterium]|nr:RNA polymerase sigma factor FliA [Vicinamibacterales bacterium]